ncbi:hypothetical protein BpJC4_03360 [Weizmannia acidilactici]|nr:hypothetical protein BpJC4_03360 [Weizmannia acidilactici]
MKERFVHVTGGRVYYKKTSTGNKTPLIVLHGGPGGTHMPMLALEALGDERPVIFYDQLGSGRSDRPHDPCFGNWKDLRKSLGRYGRRSI